MKIVIKDATGKMVDINPRDIMIDEKPLCKYLEEIPKLQKKLEKHILEEQRNALEARELWRTIKK